MKSADKDVEALKKINWQKRTARKTVTDGREHKYDEFYTLPEDISKELNKWKNKFNNQDIICPCDWDILDDDAYSLSAEISNGSIIWKTNSVKLLLPEDLFSDSITAGSRIISEEEANKLLNKRLTCNFIKYLISIAKETNIKSITASGFDIKSNRGNKFEDINYSKYTLCITNPPFSCYSAFMKLMIPQVLQRKNTNNAFNFIAIAPSLNRVTPNVGLNLMLKNCYLGYGRRIRMIFYNPNNCDIDAEERVNVDWITSYSDAQDYIDSQFMSTEISYERFKDNFQFITSVTMKDGTHPLKINDFRGIPDDYYGWMFCAVGVLDVLSNKEFEWYGTGYIKYFNKENNIFAHQATNVMWELNGQKLFHGILIRRRCAVNNNCI